LVLNSELEKSIAHFEITPTRGHKKDYYSVHFLAFFWLEIYHTLNYGKKGKLRKKNKKK